MRPCGIGRNRVLCSLAASWWFQIGPKKYSRAEKSGTGMIIGESEDGVEELSCKKLN